MGQIGSAVLLVAPKRLPGFSFVLGAENLSYVKSIETHARAFLTLNILSIGTVPDVISNLLFETDDIPF